ncbi:MAG: HAMP domain-containing protein [Firmicutes bacterium]|nr:HAMP domain-containing protein [Bacillota bacterium]
MFNSLKWRFFLSISVTVVLVSILMATLSLWDLGRAAMEEKRAAGILAANLAADSLREALSLNGGPRELGELAARLSNDLHARVLFIDTGWTVIADGYGEMLGQRMEHEQVGLSLQGQTETRAAVTPGGRALYVSVPVFEGGSVRALVFLSISIDAIYQQLVAARSRLALSGAIVAALFGCVAYVITETITRPLRRLREAAVTVGHGRFDCNLAPERISEINDVVNAFNHMAERLRSVDAMRRTFINNASHELRSPLASLKALAQGLLDAPDADPATVRDFLAQVDVEVDRLNDLGRKLLDLRRYDELGATIKRVPTDLNRIITSVATRLAEESAARGITIETPGGSEVAGDSKTPAGAGSWRVEPEWFETMLYNLVQNAVKYASSRVRVSVAVELSTGRSTKPSTGSSTGRSAECSAERPRDENLLVVEVSDDGPGIAAADLPHLFESFYRADSSRSRATGGAGLGLSIAREIAKAHGGDIAVESKPGATVFRVTVR